MILPIYTGIKCILWVVLFGLAKLFQYSGITILGVNGVREIKSVFVNKAKNKQ